MRALWLLPVFLLPSLAFGVTRDEPPAADPGAGARVGTSRKTARSGPYALIEWNPADLAFGRVRGGGEYVIVDGFAFGGAFEYQKKDEPDWRSASTAVGVTATQYFESQALRGNFLRGEIDVFGTEFSTKKRGAEKETIFGVNLGADLGYRFSLSERFTGAAAYGVRRVVPDFFATSGDGVEKDFTDNTKRWDFRVQLSLGVTL